MVLWAPPCQLKLGVLLSWGRGWGSVHGGERGGCRWSHSCLGRHGGLWAQHASFGGRVSSVGETGEVCARASGVAAGSKAQPADALGLGHGHVGQVLGAEVLCERAGAARRSTAVGAGAAAGGGSEPMWLPCLRVWAAWLPWSSAIAAAGLVGRVEWLEWCGEARCGAGGMLHPRARWRSRGHPGGACVYVSDWCEYMCLCATVV